MSLFTLQAPAGGFLDEELHRFNRVFDDWCVQFDTLEDAQLILDTMDAKKRLEIIEITPLSYPKYFFHTLKGYIFTTRQIANKIICITQPHADSNFRIAVCDLDTKKVRLTSKRYKGSLSVEGSFANFTLFEDEYL